MKRNPIVWTVAAGLLCLAALFFNLIRPYRTEPMQQPVLFGPYSVLRTIDGDTIDLQISGEAVRVRLIGVDAPESVHPESSKNTAEGAAAAAWLQEMLEDENVYLEYDVGTEDDYGRTLAYVYLSDRETMLNRLLLQEGMAQVMTVPPNVKYAVEFSQIQTAAREAGNGFWEPYTSKD